MIVFFYYSSITQNLTCTSAYFNILNYVEEFQRATHKSLTTKLSHSTHTGHAQ